MYHIKTGGIIMATNTKNNNKTNKNTFGDEMSRSSNKNTFSDEQNKGMNRNASDKNYSDKSKTSNKNKFSE